MNRNQIFVALAGVIALLILPAAAAEAFSGFKGRFVSASKDCVYTDAAGVEQTIANNETILADPSIPELHRRNSSCTCPADAYKTVLNRPATLFCVDRQLVVLEPAICGCKPTGAGGSVAQCRVCVRDRHGGTGCSGWTPKGGGQSSWSRWIKHEGGVASRQKKKFLMECR